MAVLVVAWVEVCFVGWKEERARKAARKLERNGRGGCWLGEGMVGGEASLETWDGSWPGKAGMGRCRGGCTWFRSLSWLPLSDPINESFFPLSAVSLGVGGVQLVYVGGFNTSALNTDQKSVSSSSRR